MKKQLFQLLTLSMLISTSSIYTSARYARQAAPSASESTPSSSRRAPSPVTVAPAPSMPAPSAPMSAVDLKGFAASNPADVAAGLAAGLNAKYRGGNANNAAGQAAYNFVVGA